MGLAPISSGRSGAPPSPLVGRLLRIIEWAKTDLGGRFLKYTYLVVAMSVVTIVIFEAFSLYVARRTLDEDIASQRDSGTFEEIAFRQRQARAQRIAIIETRCKERMQLAAFWLLRLEDQNGLVFAFNRLHDERLSIIKVLQDLQERKAINADELIAYVESHRFNHRLVMEKLKPTEPGTEATPEFTEARRAVMVAVDRYAALVLELGEQRKRLSDADVSEAIYRNLAIDELEKRIVRLTGPPTGRGEPLKEDGTKHVDEEYLNRVAVWLDAMTGSSSGAIHEEELSFDPDRSTDTQLRQDDCVAFTRYFRGVTGEDPWLNFPQRAIYEWQVQFFYQPQVAQTLFVTLFMGVLGALALNVLRLSKVGWWDDDPDPRWGELIIAPFIGSLAALAVFLIASTGLLLTASDAPQAAPLSAFFVGLLGFLSGLLYDEAFGQVRRVGSRIFGDESSAGGRPTQADLQFAAALEAENVIVAARIALKAHLGEILASRPGFTFFLPPEDAIPREVLEASIRAGFGPGEPQVDTWFDKHLVDERLLVSQLQQAAAAKMSVLTRDGLRHAVTVAGNDVAVAGAKIVKPDVTWRLGVIHLLDADFS